MSGDKLKTSYFCVGRLQYYGTVNFESDISKIRRKLLVGKCIECNRQKSNDC